MIEIAAALSAVVRHWPDLIIIILLLLFNVVIGFWQEHQAANAVEALKKQLALKARARRGGQWTELDAVDLAVLGGLVDQKVLADYRQLKFIPFDPVGKCTEALVEDRQGHSFRVTKGAPQVVLAMIVFDFYPITAIMIILLAFFNDVSIMAIAYDNTWINRGIALFYTASKSLRILTEACMVADRGKQGRQ